MLAYKINVTHCKLKKSIQKKLIEFFVLEVTTRSAADVLGINPNPSTLFCHKICSVISYHLALEADDVFDGQLNLMKATLVIIAKD